MILQELKTYIKSALEQGQTREAIKIALLSAGWTEADIEEGFRSIENEEIQFPPVSIQTDVEQAKGKTKKSFLKETPRSLRLFLVVTSGFNILLVLGKLFQLTTAPSLAREMFSIGAVFPIQEIPTWIYVYYAISILVLFLMMFAGIYIEKVLNKYSKVFMAFFFFNAIIAVAVYLKGWQGFIWTTLSVAFAVYIITSIYRLSKQAPFPVKKLGWIGKILLILFMAFVAFGVYRIYENAGEHKAYVADTNAFLALEKIKGNYYLDQETGKVYYSFMGGHENEMSDLVLVPGADGETLESIASENSITSYAKDKNYVYHQGEIVDGVNPEDCTYEYLDGCSEIIPVECQYEKGVYEPRFYDSEGRVTGIIKGEQVVEIPNSRITDLNEILLGDPEGVYDYEAYAVEGGNYVLSQYTVNEGERTEFEAINIPIKAGETHRYSFDWDTIIKGGEGAILMVDVDSDGVFEKTIKADKKFTCKEYLEAMSED